MKKLLLLLFISSLALTSDAQNLSVPHYGIKAGLNYSNLNFNQYNYLFFGINKPTEGYKKPTTTYRHPQQTYTFLVKRRPHVHSVFMSARF